MTPRDLVRLVLSNLARMKGRVLMTALGVLIGTMAIVVLIALALGLQKSTTESFSEFGPVNQITVMPSSAMRAFGPRSTGPTNAEAILNPATLERFRAIPDVDAVTPVVRVGGGSTLKLNQLEGFGDLAGIAPTAVKGLGFVTAQGNEHLGNWVVLAGARVAENFYNPRSPGVEIEPPDLYGRTLIMVLERRSDSGELERRQVRLRVGGILEERGGQDDTTIYMSLDNAEELQSWLTGERADRSRDGYDQAIVVVNDPARLLKIEDELDSQGFFAFSASSVLRGINLFFTIVQAVLGGVGAIALLVAAIGIANTMVMSILERTREIGLMKAVGATNRDVMSVFLVEAGAIGLLGGIGGVLLGILAAHIIDFLAQVYITAQAATNGGQSDPVSIVYIPLWLPIFALVFSMIIGLVAGIYPALRAVQLNPVMALKYE